MSKDPMMARFNVELPYELNEEFQKYLPWGTKTLIVRNLLEKALEAVKIHRTIAVADLQDGNFYITCNTIEGLGDIKLPDKK